MFIKTIIVIKNYYLFFSAVFNYSPDLAILKFIQITINAKQQLKNCVSTLILTTFNLSPNSFTKTTFEQQSFKF